MIKRIFLAIWRGLTVLRLALANLLFIALLVVLWVAISDKKPEPLPERAALVLHPTGQVVDELSRVEATSLLFDVDAVSRETLLSDLIDSVELARKDERITALVLDLDKMVSIGQSKTSELGAAIARFRDSGKPVVAIGDYYTQDQYRLAVEADTLLMHPFGAVGLEGYSVYINYFAEALEKLLVTVHVFRAGEFKSIAEPFIRSDMSPGEKVVTEAWLTDLWVAFVEAVEERRGLTSGSVDDLLSHFPERLREAGGNAGRLALQAGLVDELLDRSQQNEYLKALVGAQDKESRFAAVSFADYLSRARRRSLDPELPNIAIVVAQGNMLPGEQPPGRIGGDTLAALLRRAAERDGTGALVLRVSSGGGSVFASEIIRAEIERVRKTGMPVVVSMGNIAASGGYYIATAADRIVATPTTLTGSIGVFAAIPNFERLLAKGGVRTDGVATTPIAGGYRLDRTLSPELSDVIQLSVDDTYEQFLTLVMQSRSLDRETLDGLAEGRVLSAQDALEAGLVDKLGSLDDAVQEAASLAGLEKGSYEVITMLPEYSPGQMLLQQLGDTLGINHIQSLPLLKQLLEPVQQSTDLISSFADPGHLYMRCLACEMQAAP